MATRAPQTPRPGWIYMANPTRTVIRCATCSQVDAYDHTPGSAPCTGTYHVNGVHQACPRTHNVSRVFRGAHPLVVLTPEEDMTSMTGVLIVVPMTSKRTFEGLYTSYPVSNTTSNGLSMPGWVLCHNPLVIDKRALRTPNNSAWLKRLGALRAQELDEVRMRLAYAVGADLEAVARSHLEAHPSIESMQAQYLGLTPEAREAFLEWCIDQ